MDEAQLDQLEVDGFLVMPRVFPPDEVDRIRAELDQRLTRQNESLLKAAGGPVFAARNVADWFPAALTLWQKQDLLDLLLETLARISVWFAYSSLINLPEKPGLCPGIRTRPSR